MTWAWPLGEQVRFEAMKAGFGGRSLAQAIRPSKGYTPKKKTRGGRPSDTYRGVRRAHTTVGRGAAKRALRRATREQLEADLVQKKA